jgi:hypothetical protein
MPVHATIVLPPNSGPPRLDGEAYTNNESVARGDCKEHLPRCLCNFHRGWVPPRRESYHHELGSWLIGNVRGNNIPRLVAFRARKAGHL